MGDTLEILVNTLIKHQYLAIILKMKVTIICNHILAKQG